MEILGWWALVMGSIRMDARARARMESLSIQKNWREIL
jgi:hypothetical protein